MKKRDKTLVVFSGCWPSHRKGYEIACNATLDLLAEQYKNVIYFGPVDEDWNSSKSSYSNVNFIKVNFSRSSQMRRFLKSLYSFNPAITVRFWNAAPDVLSVLSQESTQDFDFLYEDIPTAYLLPKLKKNYPNSNHWLRSHNVVFHAFSGVPKAVGFPISIFWSYEVWRIRRFEEKVAKLATSFFAISQDDKSVYEGYGISVDGIVDVFMNSNTSNVGVSCEAKSVVFVGTADLRKGSALNDFLQYCWPLVKEKESGAIFIAGGNGTDSFHEPERGIQGLGFIDSEDDVLRKGQIFVNPQTLGSGVKLKSISAMFAGKTLVTTSVGIEGIPATKGKHYILADNWVDMADQIVSLMRSSEKSYSIGENSQKWARDYYSLSQFKARSLQAFFPEIK
ncbi:glycosyltransferase family 4 protein [Salinivibrio costicola]|uniref:glycosyltransferase family 4 protein n=1 Tax=Salinivibrio costicola TaxID=51367 RepID=UPI000395D7AB|nr:glycosyltransferase [Salinivibrio costicola]